MLDMNGNPSKISSPSVYDLASFSVQEESEEHIVVNLIESMPEGTHHEGDQSGNVLLRCSFMDVMLEPQSNHMVPVLESMVSPPTSL